MSKPQVKKASAKDLAAVVALWDEYQPEHRRIVVAENPRARVYLRNSPDASAKITKWFRGVLRSRKSAVFLAEIDGELAGFAVIMDNPMWILSRIRRIAYLAVLFVRKPYRGRGLSGVLTKAAMRWARERKLKHISLTVNCGNSRAEAIYRKWGFADIALLMQKPI